MIFLRVHVLWVVNMPFAVNYFSDLIRENSELLKTSSTATHFKMASLNVAS
jgi:hypothetical protein